MLWSLHFSRNKSTLVISQTYLDEWQKSKVKFSTISISNRKQKPGRGRGGGEHRLADAAACKFPRHLFPPPHAIARLRFKGAPCKCAAREQDEKKKKQTSDRVIESTVTRGAEPRVFKVQGQFPLAIAVDVIGDSNRVSIISRSVHSRFTSRLRFYCKRHSE